MHISQEGLNLIKEFEGLYCNAYKCPAGVWTIGYGHTEGVYEGQVITPVQAEEMLRNDMLIYEDQVNQVIGRLTQNEFDALVSFTYNCGQGCLKTLVANRDHTQIADALLLYNKAGGRVLEGLVRRRQAERELFIKKVDNSTVQANNNGYSATVRDYQRQYNETYTDKLVVDGIWGPKTENSLHNVLLKEGSKNSLVSFVQCRVGADIDCKYGPQTKQKVYEYQKAHGLVADGIVGYNTIKCILNQYK